MDVDLPGADINPVADVEGDGGFACTKNLLHWRAGKFLVSMREQCKISQHAMAMLVDGIPSLMTDYFQVVLENMESQADPVTNAINIEAIKEAAAMNSPSELFEPFKSKHQLDKFLQNDMNMIMPQLISLASWLVWKREKNKAVGLVEKEHFIHIIPFMDVLKILLKNDLVRYCIENPRVKEDNHYRTVLDGSVYQSSDIFSKNPNSIAIILYYDDLSVVNPLGANTARNKLAMFYWTIGNIYPEYRSKLAAINLLAIVKYSVLKKCGLKAVLQPFLRDISRLQSEGVQITVKNVNKVFKGSVLFCTGDTPAQGFMGGFKQSVSANRFCRTCLARQGDWKEYFRDENFVVRDRDTHEQHVRAVTEASNFPVIYDFWSRRFGVNEDSCLSEIPGFDVTKHLPQDCMHVIAEGVLEVHMRQYLKYLVTEKQIISIDDLNSRIDSFHYQQFQRDKPAPILIGHLEKGLRQSACQMIVLSLNLPFIVGKWINSYCERNTENAREVQIRQECFGLLLSIINVTLAYSITENAADYLGRMVEVHHSEFVQLYPDTITPKFHFLIHVVYYIKMFGPPRQQACFRFEGLHAYFKQLVPVVKSLVNLPYTLSYRHQARQASRLACAPGELSSTFLSEGDRFAPGITVLVSNLPDEYIFSDIMTAEERTRSVMRTKEAVVNGTTYKTNSIVLWALREESLPIFAMIEEMFVHNGLLLLKVSFLESQYHDQCLNAYFVGNKEDAKLGPILIKDRVRCLSALNYAHPLIAYSSPLT